MTRRRIAGIGVLASSAALAAWLLVPKGPTLPAVAVTRGDFVDVVPVRGEIKASRSITLLAPSDAGELRIVKLARNGDAVRKGDVVVEFDTSTVTRTLAEKESERKGFAAEVSKLQSEARTKEAAAVTGVTQAHYKVEESRLDYTAKDILPRVDGEQRRLKVLNAQTQEHDARALLDTAKVASRADTAGAEQKHEKARLEVSRAERQAQSLKIFAPTDGVFSIMPNYQAGWDTQQPFKEGDRAWSGAAIAELPEVSSLFGSARVDELERGRLEVGQAATIRVEAVPDRELRGHVGAISVLAKADFTSWPPPRNFDLSIALDTPEQRLRPGMTASIRVETGVLRNVVLVPARAVFTSNGEDVAWVVSGRHVERRVLAVGRRNADQVVALSGVAAGEQVSLVDPTATTAKGPR